MRVFISYRREDTSGQAGRLYDALADKLGAENVFMDVDTIDIGVEFKHAIEAAVSSCDVLFVMIGPRWLTAADTRGERRLSRTDDYVRLEVETALGRNIRVVPALVAGAAMPVADDLPGTLSALTLRNAVEMADGPRWQYDVSRLMNLLERIRAGESQAEAAPPIDMAALAGDLPATSASHASAADTDTERDAARRKAETIRARVASAHASAGRLRSLRRDATAPGWRRRAVGRRRRAAASRAACRMRRNGCSRSPAWASSPCSHWRSSVPTSSAMTGRAAARARSLRARAPSRTRPTTVTSAVTNSTDVPANADADQSKLWLAIPKPIRRGSCKFADSEHAGGVATINCDYDDPKHGRTLVHLDRFVDFAHLQVIYKLHGPGSVAAHGGAPDPQLKKATGGCNRTLWRGEGPWSHEAGGGVMGPVSGRYSCYQADGQCDLVAKMKLTDVNGSTCSVIVWTDLAANMFVKAEQQTSVHAGIASFYDFWHHQFG